MSKKPPLSSEELIKKLAKEFKNNPDYKPFISSIVFPNYKNLTENSDLTFDFPLTLLIGKNGTNKSSILHAVYGCPEGVSIADYWFSTHTDPINPEDDDGKRPAIFYRYTIPETGEEAEVLKLRIKNNNDPDYWEPSVPTKKRGMKPLSKINDGEPIPAGRSKTRWNAIDKKVLYLDFRAEISAFDKAFYKIGKSESRQSHRQLLRKRSRLLKDAIENCRNSKIYRRKERVFVNYTFTEKQLNAANRILGTEYQKIVYLEHDFYFSDSFSVYLRKGDDKNYSEAFAGSGETSVIRLIYALDNAAEKSLVLLDEPETSLHIEAQRLLRDHILQVINEKRLQVVISTHSPFFTNGLPEYAIKSLSVDEDTKKVVIANSTTPEQSSFYLGYRRNDATKVNVYVEDVLARALVTRVIKSLLEPSERDQIIVHHYAGGDTELLQLAAREALKDNSNITFLFDGDKNPSIRDLEIPEESTIPAAKNSELEKIIKLTFGCCPNFPRDSEQPQQEIENYRKFLKFAKSRFHYLPCNGPEEFIVQNHADLRNRSDISDPKLCLSNYTNETVGLSGEVKSNNILNTSQFLLSKIEANHVDLVKISNLLKSFLKDKSLISSL